MTSEVRVPTLGESVTEATVATWFKKPGDSVAVDEMLCELETDKVTVEVPSPVAGTLADIVAAEGETVGVDALLANISEGDAAPAKSEAPKAVDAGAEDVKPRDAADDVDVMVPTLGESVSEATVSTWFKTVGDHVEVLGLAAAQQVAQAAAHQKGLKALLVQPIQHIQRRSGDLLAGDRMLVPGYDPRLGQGGAAAGTFARHGGQCSQRAAEQA